MNLQGYDHAGKDDAVYEEDQEDEPTNESASISKVHLSSAHV